MPLPLSLVGWCASCNNNVIIIIICLLDDYYYNTQTTQFTTVEGVLLLFLSLLLLLQLAHHPIIIITIIIIIIIIIMIIWEISGREEEKYQDCIPEDGDSKYVGLEKDHCYSCGCWCARSGLNGFIKMDSRDWDRGEGRASAKNGIIRNSHNFENGAYAVKQTD